MKYIDSWNRFEETNVPPIDAFYSNLNMTSIGEEDYAHARRVWSEFGITNLGQYHDLYLKTDVILLANVFQTFRDTCLQHYGLDPAHFYTSPALAWRACLKRTGIKLELEVGLLIRFASTQQPTTNIWEMSSILPLRVDTFNT